MDSNDTVIHPSISGSPLQRPIAIDLKSPATFRFFIWLIFLTALGIRLVGLGDYPARHATNDEFHYIWAGANFWDHGTPDSWTGLHGISHLKIGTVQFDTDQMEIISPALDHPPLFSRLAGGFARLTGATRQDTVTPEGKTVTVWDVDLGTARWLMIAIFIPTFWFLFGIARVTYPPGVALLIMLFYAFMSHAIAQSRLIVSDNLSALFFVANVWAVQRWLKGIGSEKAMATWTILLTALAVITKIPAWCQVPALMAMLFVAGKRWQARYVVYGFALGVSLYFCWIYYFGLQDFIKMMGAQASRFRGFNAFQLISGLPRLLETFDLNGLIIAGWFCLFAQMARPGGASSLAVLAPVYMLTFTFFAGDYLFGWYSLPFYPWLAIALGVTTAQVWSRPRSPLIIGWLLLLLPHAFQTLYIARYDLEQLLRYAYAATFAGILLLFALNRKTASKALRIAMIAILAVVLMREFYEVIYQRTDRISDKEKYIH